MTASTWFSPDWNSAAVCFLSSLCAWLLLRLPSDVTAVAWSHQHGLKFYPRWMTTSPQRLVSVVFWHTMFWTMNMPIAHYVSGLWSHAEHTPQDIAAAVNHLTNTTPSGIANITLTRPKQFYDPESEPYAQLSFMLHLTFGVLWLFMSYITMVWLDHGANTGSSKRRLVSSRITGYIAFACLCAHVAAGLLQVYVDVVHNKPLNKFVLAASALFALTTATKAVRLAKRGRLADHQDAMIYAFIISVNGAGNIRQIAFFQDLLGVGPAVCLNEVGCMSLVRWNVTECVFPYHFRLNLIGMWSSVIHGAYAAIRRKPSVTQEWWSVLKFRVVFFLTALGFSYVPGAVAAMDIVMGAERSAQGAIVTILMLIMSVYKELAQNIDAQPTPKQTPSHPKISGTPSRANLFAVAPFLSSSLLSFRMKHRPGANGRSATSLPNAASFNMLRKSDIVYHAGASAAPHRLHSIASL